MNAEYLLDAIGLLDDGLLREAEEYRRPRRDYRRWIGLAATFAVVLTLGYAAFFLRLGGGMNQSASGGATNAPSDPLGGMFNGGDGTYGSAGGAEEPPVPEPDSPSGSAPAEPDASFTPPGTEPSESEYYVVRICVTDGNTQYTYDCRFDGVTANGPQVEVTHIETLPEGCRSLGRLRQIKTEEDFSLPHTDSGWYTGCPLWIQGEGWEGPVYLELPQGGYLMFEHSQTYDLSP